LVLHRKLFQGKRSRSLLSRRCNRRTERPYRKNVLIAVVYRVGCLRVLHKLSRFVPFDLAAPDGGGGVGGFHDAERPGDSISTIPHSPTFDILTYIIATSLSWFCPRWHVDNHKARPRRRACQIYCLISGDTLSRRGEERRKRKIHPLYI